MQGLGLPYVLVDSLTLNSNLTLSISAGVVIKFQYQASVYDKRILIVNGILDLQSTAANPIVFTSDRDDTIGGDTNGDGSASQPAKGDWGYIKLTNSATIFHDAAVRYGGTHYAGSYYNYMLWVSNASPTIRNTTLAYASDTALRVDGGNPTITGNNVSDSINGIHVQNASPAISTNTVSRNTGCGIIVDGASGLARPTISSNVITGNGYPLYQLNYTFPTYSGNTISGNTHQAIAVAGNIVPASPATAAWPNVQGLGLPYVLVDSLTLNSNLTLSISAGVVIKFQYQASVYDKRILIVNGILDLQSTAANPIVFTSDRDDTIGGDTNGDGSASQPAKGDWGYIKLTNSATIFHDAAVRYGGTHYAGSYYNYMLWVSNASPTIRNTTLAYASDTALRVDGGNPTITGNNVSDSINGIHVQNASPAISTNTVSRNTGCGIIVDGASGLAHPHDQQQCHHRQRLSPVSAQLYLPHLQWQHHQR